MLFPGVSYALPWLITVTLTRLFPGVSYALPRLITVTLTMLFPRGFLRFTVADHSDLN